MSAGYCNSSEYTHLRAVRSADARPPFFFFCPGAPGARVLAEFMPEDQPIYEFWFPNIEGESSFPTVEELATIYVQEIRKVQGHGPYQLCGYSHSGLFAYETARMLLSQGEEVSFLALLETWHPGYSQNQKSLDLMKRRILYIVDRLGTYGRNLIHGRFNYVIARAHENIAKHAKLIAWRAIRSFYRTGNRPVPKAMEIVESKVVLKSYIPKPYPKRFMLFRTHDNFEKKLNDQTFGWHVCALKGVDVHFTFGDHETMVLQPYISTLVADLMPYLANASQPSSVIKNL